VNAVLIDDERLARAELRRLLRPHGDVRIVGEAQNVEEAVALVERHPVDLLFLDIQMPDGTGFDLLERLDRVPRVIFTTAYDEHAIHAFDVNALDYLLKPIAPERLELALDRARQPVGPEPSRLDRVFVRDGDRCWLVGVDDIRLFEAEGNYTRVHFGAHRPLIHRSLQALEGKLDPRRFFRASRSHIINLTAVDTVDQDVDGGLIVALRGGLSVKVSRRQSKRLRDELSL
jgi:two-component system, LytTR family, response regulator